MTDTQQDSTPETSLETPAPEVAAPTGGAGLTVPEMREWLRNWIAKATGVSPDRIDDSAPMVEMGLSSRDAVAMAADIEDLTGVTLTATVAFQHPTIESLATRIIEGEPEVPDAGDEDWSRDPKIAAGEFDIAVVGLSARLPGDVNSPAQLWEALLEGRDAITDLPEGRWEEFTAEPRIAERVAQAATRGGYLKDIKGFDAEFFTLSKMEADNMDPQQRIALELTWEALENARIPASSLKGESVGVYIGSSNNDYSYLSVADPTVTHPYAITGNASSIIANRVSYFYDFRGPSVAVDTACSSSLVAVHQGVKALRSGEADVVVAGGVNALITPVVTVGFDEVGGVLAPDGRIKSFSQDANGYSRSEGGGMLVLKRLSDARRDGDPIMAIIAGSAVNHDGRSNGLLAPNPDAQAEVLRKAYKDAGIDPRSVDVIEAHGTGTILGDPIEADGLGRVVGRGRDADKPALLGSAKSNFGHLESAAGAASLSKIVLALQNNKVPPSINYTGPNPYIDFDAIHLKVVDQVSEWPRYSGHAIAGVSGFGFGGANAHIVVREVLPIDLVEPSESTEPESDDADTNGKHAVAEADTADGDEFSVSRFDEYGEFTGGYSDEPYELPGLTDEAKRLREQALAEASGQEPVTPVVPLFISGFLSSRKKAAAAALADWMETEEGQSYSLESIGRSLSRRNHGRSRAVVLAHDHEEAIKGLRAVAEGKQKPYVYSADGPVSNGPVWVMAGFGAQHRKMGKSLYLRDPIFAEWIDKVDSYVQEERGYSVVELILDDSHEYGIETSNIAIFAIQIGLGEVLKAHGAKPTAVIGQSLGEPASAYFAGGLSLADATRVICSRAHLMGEGEAMLFGDYIRLMALVEYSADELKTVFADFPDLEVCVYAAPSQTVIGGPPAQVDAIVARCEAEGKFARKLQTKGAGHTSQMDPLLGEFAAELQGIEPMSPKIGIFSTVHEGTFIRGGGEPVHDVDYWKKGMRHSVYFTHGTRNAVDAGHTTFLELAPNPVALMQVGLTTMASGLPDAQLIATLARKEDEVESMVKAMAQLYVHGHALDPRTLFSRAAKSSDYAPIPATEFKRKPHWLPAHFSADGSTRIPGTHVSLPDGKHVWEWSPREVAGVDFAELVKTAATSVLPGAQLTAFEQRAIPGEGSTLVTTLSRHPGGATVQVHARIGESFTLVYDAVVSRAGQGGALPFATAAGVATNGSAVVSASAAPSHAVAVVEEEVPEEIHDNLLSGAGAGADFKKWSKESGEPVIDRLATIVSMAMGYEPEDVPREVPLIELGLDSLMAVRIKNRVEFDFDLPPIQLQAVRDANLLDVERLVIYALENPDAVHELHDYQQTDEFKEAAPTGGMLSKADIEAALTAGAAESVPAEVPAAEPAADSAPPAIAQEATISAETSELAKAAAAMNQEAIAEALNADVPPRDAAERVAFATWAIVTGESPGSIFNALPKIDDATAEKLAERLSQRADGEIPAEEVKLAPTIEALGEVVRSRLEAGKIDGFVRTLAPRQEGSTMVPVFVFHPAGGSTVVYEPLLKRLPEGTPMFGFERVEGTIEERAAKYVPKLMELHDGPFILAGWSLGAVLAYACAVGLKEAGAEVAWVGNIDGVRPGTPILQTKEETRKRWDRYAAFAQKTFNVEIPAIPYEQLEELDDAGQVTFVLEAVKASGVQIPGGIIEHQRTSYLDQRAIDTSTPVKFDGHMTLYMADRYHDDAITFEPAYATRQPDGGWGEFVSDLEVVPVGGEHIQVIDEPIIAKVGAHMSQALRTINAQQAQQA
ncbi:Polyketide synthase PKS13 [Mycobacteroides abscessus subsp. bolletii]|uniref:polyketide synthase Pks13 n=2 Tax=Mycobacteroides abscessus TaxID=36809 RepID=UPI00092CD486|nr:polyketide synthase Pks13 [Mycobacteroides abscessus]MDO3335971.1 polyketide synthase Pks13 [Mycobacteroides abscessus subsp. bolletii]QSM89361.1 acyltransferase domain-containing protein [Mycobacteroides abscessus subsp. bolletii]UEA48652.1 acyltransferase domain-containing protein [Mycobacteroides abscessus subsp. abscessus]UEA51365.1 acyltransferase domain-containing protein [Mycobacteroides abscessus]SHQ90919.1 Polyketide synthase PKS13 [Mycobacteroides abscessus subsp. bolletii]